MAEFIKFESVSYKEAAADYPLSMSLICVYTKASGLYYFCVFRRVSLIWVAPVQLFTLIDTTYGVSWDDEVILTGHNANGLGPLHDTSQRQNVAAARKNWPCNENISALL